MLLFYIYILVGFHRVLNDLNRAWAIESRLKPYLEPFGECLFCTVIRP